MAKRKTGKTKKSGSGGTAEKPEQQVRRRHPAGLRQQAVERMELGGNVSELAREFGVHRNLLYYWRDRRKGDPAHAAAKLDPETVKVRELEGRIASLEGSLGRKTLELDFFASALQRIAGRRPSSKATGETASTPKSGTERGRRKLD